ncbi:PIN domain-containing protein [Candidatus Micrarchaeota archaeon]|nr:PIN domain-containing protein [Candidatus Micrarchaeota archaeon]
MLLVVDANVLYSAFLRDGLTRKVLFNRDLQLYAPTFLLDEFFKYFAEFCQRSRESPDEMKQMVGRIFRRIKFVELDELDPYYSAAGHLIVDEKDRVYAACALAVGADLWSADRHFRQPRIRVWSTGALAEELGLL